MQNEPRLHHVREAHSPHNPTEKRFADVRTAAERQEASALAKEFLPVVVLWARMQKLPTALLLR